MFLVYYSKQPVATSCNVSKILCTYMYMFFKRAGLYALASCRHTGDYKECTSNVPPSL